MRSPLSAGFAAILFGALSGCDSGATAVSANFGSGDRSLHQRSVSSTVQRFTGGRSVVGPTSGGSLIGQVPKNVLDPGHTGERVHQRQTQQVSITVQRPISLRNARNAKFSVKAFVGRAGYNLPDGAGILVEPIDMTFRTHGIEGQVAVYDDVPISHHARVRFELGIGFQLARARVRISSPVLDVRNTSDHAAAFLQAGASVPLTRQGTGTLNPSLDVRGRVYQTGDAQAQFGLALNF